jgi:hypothetical protein
MKLSPAISLRVTHHTVHFLISDYHFRTKCFSLVYSGNVENVWLRAYSGDRFMRSLYESRISMSSQPIGAVKRILTYINLHTCHLLKNTIFYQSIE